MSHDHDQEPDDGRPFTRWDELTFVLWVLAIYFLCGYLTMLVIVKT